VTLRFALQINWQTALRNPSEVTLEFTSQVAGHVTSGRTPDTPSGNALTIAVQLLPQTCPKTTVQTTRKVPFGSLSQTAVRTVPGTVPKATPEA
jgi:hypothetical protein